MTAQKHKEPKEISKPAGQEPEKGETTLGFTGLLGIVLLAGALFNVPAIMKVPVTTDGCRRCGAADFSEEIAGIRSQEIGVRS